MGAMRETIAGMYGNTYWTEISKTTIIPHTITDTGINTKKTNNKTKQLRNRKN